MKYKKLMLVTFLLLAILTIGSVSASDDINDTLTVDNAQEEIINAPVEEINVNDGESLAAGSDSNFTQLDNDIISGDGNLTHDYAFDPDTESELFGDGLKINKSIDGHGHTIDFARSDKSIVVVGYDVVVSNLVFKNSYSAAVDWLAQRSTLLNCTFINCGTNESAVGAVEWEGVNGTMADCNFIGCRAYWVGWQARGTVWWTGNNGRILNSKFTDCVSAGSGAIYWYGDNGAVEDCYFDNCSGGDYGAVYWVGKNGSITDSIFTNCVAIDCGGAIYWSAANGTVAGCNFDNCSVQDNGGAILWDGNNGLVDNCNFTNCFIEDINQVNGADGGAIYWCTVLNGTISNCNFDNCYARSGGAVFWNGGDNSYWDGNSWIDTYGTILNCNFTNCFANMQHDKFVGATVANGGAVLLRTGSGIIADCNFIKCSAERAGGAIERYKGSNTVSIDDCNFVDCSANTGGAIRAEGILYVNNGSFTNCHANENGGAINGGNSVYVNRSDFTNCSANGSYGGGAINGGSAVNCIFINNSATGNNLGGGALADCSAANCIFIGNHANMDGGAIRSASAVNSTFINNHANTSGGAISGGSAVNCTFINNSALGTNGGALVGGSAENSIFINNYANNSGGAICNIYAKYQTVTNCSFINNTAGTGNGGAIYCTGHACEAFNSTFINNSALGGSGGALYSVSATNSTFAYNSAYKEGGAMNGARAVDCTFTGNSALTGNGGAVLGTTTKNCSFIGNSADNGRGGAISNGHARNCTFFNNTASSDNNWFDTNVPYLNLKVSDFNSTYGFGESVFFNATDGENSQNDVSHVIITLRVYSNGTLVKTVDCLANNYWVVDLDAGNYTADMAIEHNSYRLSKTSPIKLTIAKMPTNIASSDVMTVYNADDYLIAVLKDIKGNPVADVPVSVDINGAANYTTDENGTVKVSTKGVDANAYSAAIAFEGNNNYAASSAAVNVTVGKAASAISSADVTTAYNGGKYLTVTLKDEFGNPISGAKVSVNINGAKTITTDADGNAKLTTDGYAPKSYTVKISFAGDDNYNASSTTAKVTVKKATVKLTAKAKSFKKSVKTKKYAVTLKTNKNKVMKNTKLTIKVNKKTYTAKTNNKGQATFKITKLTKKGKYTATVKYAGSKYYNAKSVKVKITVK